MCLFQGKAQHVIVCTERLVTVRHQNVTLQHTAKWGGSELTGTDSCMRSSHLSSEERSRTALILADSDERERSKLGQFVLDLKINSRVPLFTAATK